MAKVIIKYCYQDGTRLDFCATNVVDGNKIHCFDCPKCNTHYTIDNESADVEEEECSACNKELE